jgi:hypothetical protein
MRQPAVVRGGVLISTTVAAWALLSLGGVADNIDLRPGALASREYRAAFANKVVDVVEWERSQEEAAASVDPVYENTGADQRALDDLEELFDLVEAGVAAPSVETPTTLPEAIGETVTAPTAATTTTAAAPTTTGGESTTTAPPEVETIELRGRLYVDVDSNGVWDENPSDRPADAGLVNVEVVIRAGAFQARVPSQADGSYSAQVPIGEVTVEVLISDPDFPVGLTLSSDNATQVLTCESSPCEASPIGYRPAVRSLDEQVSDLESVYVLFDRQTLETLASIATLDVTRVALGQPALLDEVRRAAITRMTDEYSAGILEEDLFDIRSSVISNPPLVFDGTVRNQDAGAAAANVVEEMIRPNLRVDEEAWEAAMQAARAEVPPVERTVEKGELIALQGVELSQFQVDAIKATGAARGRAEQPLGLLAVISVLVGSLGFYIARFRPEFWDRPRMLALFGLLLVLAAGAVRATGEVQAAVAHPSAWYALPAVAFGLMTAVLFDSRLAVLMALGVTILAAAGTRDPGVSVFAMLATITPIGFVSSLSSRKAFRQAVLFSSLAVAVIAAASSWFFHTDPDQSPLTTMALAAGWGFGVSLVAALVAQAVLQFFEVAFDVTTNLRLLDLTDRNHEALALLQEEAFGTFNHSLLVGTLADAAARAIGANALLARAAAYFHDLGKTESPTMFIENQFGIPNPHDELEPLESVAIIRRHVTRGVELAKAFGIPTEVTEGILTHHGDGVMRYFYEKARGLYGDEKVDPSDFRHVGHKPHSAEMAVVMLADSLEAACRAVFRDEPPTPNALEKVVNRVVDEKINDGQLSESSLTLAQLTAVRRAFLNSLIGHYHQRIAYPNFPESSTDR